MKRIVERRFFPIKLAEVTERQNKLTRRICVRVRLIQQLMLGAPQQCACDLSSLSWAQFCAFGSVALPAKANSNESSSSLIAVSDTKISAERFCRENATVQLFTGCLCKQTLLTRSASSVEYYERCCSKIRARTCACARSTANCV